MFQDFVTDGSGLLPDLEAFSVDLETFAQDVWPSCKDRRSLVTSADLWEFNLTIFMDLYGFFSPIYITTPIVEHLRDRSLGLSSDRWWKAFEGEGDWLQCLIESYDSMSRGSRGTAGKGSGCCTYAAVCRSKKSKLFTNYQQMSLEPRHGI